MEIIYQKWSFEDSRYHLRFTTRECQAGTFINTLEFCLRVLNQAPLDLNT